MKKRMLKEIRTAENTMEAFGGYDHRLRIAEGNFYNEKNLTSRYYPVMSTRDARAKLADIEGLQGVLAKETLAWVANGQLYYGGEAVEQIEPGDRSDPTACEPFLLSEGRKTMVAMGANIVIYPDNMMYSPNTGKWEHLFVAFDGNADVYPYYDDDTVAAAVQRYDKLPGGRPIIAYVQWRSDEDYPEGYNEGQFWMVDNYAPKDGDVVYVRRGETIKTTPPRDDEGYYYNTIKDGGARNNDMLYRYTVEGTFERIPTRKILARITSKDLNEWKKRVDEFSEIKGRFRVFSGLAERVLAGTVVSVKSSNDGAYYVDIILEVKEDFDLEELVAEKWLIEYPRKPILDIVVENGNRLWGCRYGEGMNGEMVNEIYSSSLGDPAGWNIFEGIASDSYAVTVGSDGPFTGAICYSDCMYFFKENGFHRVTGNKPANYQVKYLSCHGVEKGSERSLVIHGDAMYYKGVDGIYCYDGSIPYKISEALGGEHYNNAVAGVLGDRIYFEMEDLQGEKRIFVYDTAKKLWHIEEAVGALQFVPAYGNLMYVSENGLGIMEANGPRGVLNDLFNEAAVEGAFSWFGEFGDFGLSEPDAKYVSKIRLRVTAEPGARITVEAMCDSDGSWETVAVFAAKNKQSVTLPIITRRCDHFRLRLSGVGGFKLWTLTKEIESTSEVRE